MFTFLLWFFSIAAISMMALIGADKAPNPDAFYWVLGFISVNVICVVRLMSTIQKLQYDQSKES